MARSVAEPVKPRPGGRRTASFRVLRCRGPMWVASSTLSEHADRGFDRLAEGGEVEGGLVAEGVASVEVRTGSSSRRGRQGLLGAQG